MQTPYTATFEHPELTIKHGMTRPVAVNGSVVGVQPETWSLQMTSANPNVQQFIQMLVTLAIQTAPIWLPLVLGSPAPSKNN